MKIFLEKATFINRAPFESLELDFCENAISVLSSENGKGKTTILSHVADAFHEMARPNFPNEFEGKENKLYRISSPIHNLDQSKPSFVYFRFRTPESIIDYVDIRNVCTETQYNEAILLEDKIPFGDIESNLTAGNYVKKVSSSFDKKNAEKIFSENLLTFFPSYRFEKPGYLNDPYQITLNFKKESNFTGMLRNPLEVVSGLSQFSNWLMDIVLDISIKNNIQNDLFYQNLNAIITQTLSSKQKGNLRFGIGPRGHGSTRIQILENKVNGEQIYPTIFNLSSGESSLLCLFGELLRQSDNISNNIQLPNVTGIVLVDEIDKHLHIKLQKEVLPLLLGMFPNVQFIVSSHSPFMSLGLAEKLRERSKLIDIESGFSIHPTNDRQYQEVYDMMIEENIRYRTMYESIVSQVETEKELQIITEGKNTEHIAKAITTLDKNLMDRIKIITGSEDRSGDQQLKNTFDIMRNANHSSKFLFVWDCDSIKIVNSVSENLSFFKFCLHKNEDNSRVKKGIENIYDEIFFTEDVYDKKETENDYGGSKVEININKSRFLEKIKQENRIEIFHNFSPLVDKINSIINPPV